MFIHLVVHPSLIPVVGGDPLKETSTAVVTALQGGDQLPAAQFLCYSNCTRLHSFRQRIYRTKTSVSDPDTIRSVDPYPDKIYVLKCMMFSFES
jgi:hypothetical protein